MEKKIIIPVPFNAHFHARKGGMMYLVMPYTARQYGGGLPMPNCQPIIRNTADAKEYKSDIMATIPAGTDFALRIPFYLTDTTDVEDVCRGFREGHICGGKFYPLGATTGSDSGISSIKNIAHTLKMMESEGVPLHIHGETLKDKNGKRLNPFRGMTESQFMGNELMEILDIAPDLIIFYEHLSMYKQAQFVNFYPNIRATVTPMHLGYDQCDYLSFGGKRAWNLPITCLPVLKDSEEVEGLWEEIVKHPEKYCSGDDSASHDDAVKASLDCGGCSGAFVAPTSVEQYATIFELRGQLDIFMSFMNNGWIFQNLAIPERTITLVREETMTPKKVKGFTHSVTPFQPGSILPWKLEIPANEIEITTSVY